MAFPTSGPAVAFTAPWQVEYNGLLMGAGTPYEIQSIDGLGQPPMRTGDVDRALDFGQLPGEDLFGGRDITVVLDVLDASGTQLLVLSQYTIPQIATELPFFVNLSPLAGWMGVMARCRKREAQVNVRYVLGKLAMVTMQFHATDPRLYYLHNNTSLSWLSGTSIAPVGNIEQRPVLTITGPLSYPFVSNVTLGASLNFASLTGGQVLVVDLLTHEITLNGAPAPQYILPGSGPAWWWLNPTGGNTIEWGSSDGSQPGGSSASISWCSAAFDSAM